MDHIAMMSHVGIGIGRKMPLNGLTLELGFADLSGDGETTAEGGYQSGSGYQPPSLPSTESTPGSMSPSGGFSVCSKPGLTLRSVPRPCLIVREEPSAQAIGKGETAREEPLDYRAVPIQLALDKAVQVPTVPSQPWPQALLNLFLHNFHRHKSQTAVAGLMLLLLSGHVALNFIAAAGFLQVTPLAYLIYCLVFPLGPFLMPCFAFVGMASSSVETTRLFACFNLLCLLNDVALLVSGGVLLRFLGIVEGIVVPAIMLVVNVLLIFVGNTYVSLTATYSNMKALHNAVAVLRSHQHIVSLFSGTYRTWSSRRTSSSRARTT
jgi:hypothetical protein